MARLITAGITSLDGYINDADGGFDWAMPDEQVHAFANELERSVGTAIYGRRMYEVMQFWDDVPAGENPIMDEFAQIWGRNNKIVVSTTLEKPTTAKTVLKRDLDWLEQFKAEAERDISIGGPTLAASAVHKGLVDEFHQFLTPVVVGGGTSFFPAGVFQRLELIDEKRFDSGVVYLRYQKKENHG